MRHFIAVFFLVVPASYLHAQKQEYPNWIAERYCATWEDKSECQSKLKASDLYGQTNGLAQTSDADNDGELDQWGQDVTFPRLAQCSYAHPKRPETNYGLPCFYTISSRISAFLTQTMRVGVENGSGFTLASVTENGRGTKFLVGELPAQPAPARNGICLSVLQTSETFCVGRSVQSQSTSSSVQTEEATQVTTKQGICLVLRGTVKLDEEPCREEIGCTIGEDSGEANCTQRYTWPSGSVTVLQMFEGYAVDAINGSPASGLDGTAAYWNHENERNCAVNDNSGNSFCFSTVTISEPKTDTAEVSALLDALVEEIRPLEIVGEKVLEEVLGVLVETLSHHTARGKIGAVRYMFANPTVTAQFVSKAIVDDLGKWQTTTGLVTSVLVMATVNAMANFAYEKELSEGDVVDATIARQGIRYVGSIVNASISAGSAGGNPQVFIGTLIGDQASFIAQDVLEIREVGMAIDRLFEEQAISRALFELRIASLIRLGRAPQYSQTNPKLFEDFANQSFTSALGADVGMELFKVAGAAETARVWAEQGDTVRARELVETVQGFMGLLDEKIQPIAADILILAVRSFR